MVLSDGCSSPPAVSYSWVPALSCECWREHLIERKWWFPIALYLWLQLRPSPVGWLCVPRNGSGIVCTTIEVLVHNYLSVAETKETLLWESIWKLEFQKLPPCIITKSWNQLGNGSFFSFSVDTITRWFRFNPIDSSIYIRSLWTLQSVYRTVRYNNSIDRYPWCNYN